MNYDLEKIRVACLELMGWRRETSQNWLDKQTDVIWTGPDGKERREGLPLPNPIPEPTKSLDAVLPLMEKYGIRLGPPFVYERKWEAYSANYAIECFDESPALAVCLCALRCAGRILEDFEVSP